MDLITKLESLGCDVEGAMERFVGDRDMYVSCYRDALNDFAFNTLNKALKDNDKKLAFEASHTLKSIIGNLGLTPLYNAIEEIVEPLRRDEDVDLTEKMEKFSSMYKNFLELIDEI